MIAKPTLLLTVIFSLGVIDFTWWIIAALIAIVALILGVYIKLDAKIREVIDIIWARRRR